MKSFPKDFLWGASTAAYQVEGGIHNQWSEWEAKQASRLAQESPVKLGWLPHQDRIATDLVDPQNYQSANGVEHYKRFETDFNLLQELNMNAFRFGIEWARLEPEEGVWNEEAFAHYKRYIAELKKRNIEPMLTIWHWTMPVWFAKKGGFEHGQNVAYFERFVQKVAEMFATDLRYVLTINEPNVYASFSYMIGEWPPQQKRPLLGLKVYRNLVKAHRAAYHILKQANPNIQVGIAHQVGETRAEHPGNPLNRLTVRCIEYVWAWWFMDRIKNQSDFIGINFYFTEYRDWLGRMRNPKAPVSNLGWYMEPQGLGDVLIKTWQRYHKPLVVTENGLADATDEQRQWWLEETMRGLQAALDSGADLRGYLHWSLLDNFEWAYGWWPKFGLIAVDRTTMQRTIRPSARWFAQQIEQYRS